jgi:hypothetical protein
MTKEELTKIVEESLGEDENILLADGFEDAFIGIGRQFNTPFAIYDREKCIDILMEDMSNEEAEEYFEFNVQGAYVGENTPVFVEMLKFNQEIKNQMKITEPLPDTEQDLFYSAINALRIAGQEKLADDFEDRMENLLHKKSK